MATLASHREPANVHSSDNWTPQQGLRYAWYAYLTLLVLGPVLLDAGLQVAAERHVAWRAMRLGVVCAIIPLAWMSLWSATETRMPNMDLIAKQIRDQATASDLVIVNPWWMGISFQRYYDGAAPWMTLPDISDHRAHRYDLFKEKMTEVNPNGALLEQVLRTLRAGHRVWTVGPVYLAGPNTQLERLPPAPHPLTGWREGPYLQYWHIQLALVLRDTGSHFRNLKIDAGGPVNRHESPDLSVWESSRTKP